MIIRKWMFVSTLALNITCVASVFADTEPTTSTSQQTSIEGMRFDLNKYSVAYMHDWQARGGPDDAAIWRSADDEISQTQEDSGGGGGGAAEPNCARFGADADVGDIIRAGCKPSIAQMSALMDNPLGNVAMLFNQYDSYRMENPANGKEAIQGNFMGIIQFPKKLNDD